MSPMRLDAPSLRAIAEVADRLGELRSEVVFVGGAIVPLLITDQAAGPDRPTNDVDIVVEATSVVTYYALSDRLRQRGFVEDDRDDPPVICRWRHGVHRVDVMPVEGRFLGFRGAWFRAVCDRPWIVELQTGISVRVVRAPELLATKAEAFRDRGRGDFVASKDLEDFVSIVNGRSELIDELREAPQGVRTYVADVAAEWLRDDDFMDALPGHLGGDDSSQARLSIVLSRFRAICEVAR